MYSPDKLSSQMDELFYVNQILRILVHYSVRQDFIQTLMAHQSSDDLIFFFIFLFWFQILIETGLMININLYHLYFLKLEYIKNSK